MDVAPGVFWDSINEYNENAEQGWTIAQIEGKGFCVSKKADSEEETDLKVNIKFYGIKAEDEDQKTRTMVRFNRKSGAIDYWAK